MQRRGCGARPAAAGCPSREITTRPWRDSRISHTFPASPG
ncbi:hypothetical protein KPATCC21470_8104 [Kitasatospora purpeofusca]